VKRQNKHIQQLETFLDQLEKRHKEYKIQLREYADQVHSLRTLEHVQGDEALKQRIQALLVERDALAAELHLLQEEREKYLLEKQLTAAQVVKEAQERPQTQLDASTGSARPPNSGTTKEDNSTLTPARLELESIISKLKSQLEESTSSHRTKESSLSRTIEIQQKDITFLQSQVQQMAAACEALKSRLNHSSTQHASQLQQFTSNHESKLQTLNDTISQLQHELTSLKQRSDGSAKTESTLVSSASDPSVHGDLELLVQERDSLKSQVDALLKQLKSQASDDKVGAASAPNSTSVVPTIAPSLVQSVSASKEEVNMDSLASPHYRELAEKKETIRVLEEKLQSKQSLLVKAHKHLGELTAQLADANLRAEQVVGERARVEQLSTLVSELHARNAQLEAYLEESIQEFRQYKAKVTMQEENARAARESLSAPSDTRDSASDIPIVLQEKMKELQRQVEQLQNTNASLRNENEMRNSELSQLRAKHDSTAAQLRHLKEKDVSRATLLEKHQAELKSQEERLNGRILALQTQLDASSSTSNSQLAKLRNKADDTIQQKDTEIAMLKDTIEVLKVQLSQPEPKRPSSAASRVTESSIETSRRRVAGDQSMATPKAGVRASEALPERTPSPSSRMRHDAPSSSAIDSKMVEDQSAQIQTLLGRLKSLQDQVSELEQLLALSREQEQFLKLELRRSDRSASPSFAVLSSSSPSTPTRGVPSGSAVQGEFASPNDFVIIRSIIKNMLERREIPNVAVFADILRFTPEEMEGIAGRAKEASGAATVANAVGNGINALWSVFGSPQR